MSKAFYRFREIIEKKTGNPYEVYVDLCESLNVTRNMDSFNTVVSGLGVEKFAKNFILVSDLKEISEGQDADAVAERNRLTISLRDYAEGINRIYGEIWKIIPGEGVLARANSGQDSYLISVNDSKEFEISLTSDALAFKRINQHMESLDDPKPTWKPIGTGMDLDAFQDIIEDHILSPEKEPNLISAVKAEKKPSTPSPF